jgi:hypothetical protein
MFLFIHVDDIKRFGVNDVAIRSGVIGCICVSTIICTASSNSSIELVNVSASTEVESSRNTNIVAALTSVPAAICADSSRTIRIDMSDVDVVADTVVDSARPASRFIVDVDVDAAIVAESSISAPISSSICDRDVPAATTDCNSRNIFIDAVDDVCVSTDVAISRRTLSSDADVVVDAAIVVDSSRSIAVMSSICDNVVCAAIVDDSSRSISIFADDAVVAPIALVNSRSTLNDGVEVDVVTAMVVVSSRNAPIRSSICDRDVPAATVVDSSLSMSTVALDADCAASVDVSSLSMFNSDAPADVVAAIVADSSRNVPINNSICDSDVVAETVVSNSRSTFNGGVDVAVVAASVVDISRSSSKSDADVIVVAAIAACISRSIFAFIDDVDVADVIVEEISRRFFNCADVDVVAFTDVVISRNIFALADDNAVVDAIVVDSSRSAPPAATYPYNSSGIWYMKYGLLDMNFTWAGVGKKLVHTMTLSIKPLIYIPGVLSPARPTLTRSCTADNEYETSESAPSDPASRYTLQLVVSKTANA